MSCRVFVYHRHISALLVTSVLLLAGCASSGVTHRPSVTDDNLANYEVDLEQCQLKAKQYSSDDAEKGGVLGALAGAIAGATDGGEQAIVGAAIGAVIGVASGSFMEDTERRKIVVECMREKGYNVCD